MSRVVLHPTRRLPPATATVVAASATAALLLVSAPRPAAGDTTNATLVCETHVRSDLPDQSFGSDRTFHIRKDTETIPMEAHALLHFSADAIPYGATITDAVLSQYVHGNSYAGGKTAVVTLVELGAVWDESTVTWNNKPSTEAAAGQVEATLRPYALGTQDTWNVTALLQYARDSIPASTPFRFGFLTKFPDTSTGDLYQEWWAGEAVRLTITYESSPRRDEDYGPGSTRDFGRTIELGDPIAASSGAYHFSMPLLNLGGPMGLDFSLIYRSDLVQQSEADPGDLPDRFWWSPKQTATFADDAPNTWTIQMADGNWFSFKKDGAEWALVDDTDFPAYEDNESAVRYVLRETTGYLYFMDPVMNRVHIFEKITPGGELSGRIAYVLDRNHNQLAYTYGSAGHNCPARIQDNLGRSLDLGYGNGLTTVTDQAGRGAAFAYEDAADNNGIRSLRFVTNAMGQVTTFAYSTTWDAHNNFTRTNNVAAVRMPLGNAAYTQTYATVEMDSTWAARVTSQADAYDNTLTLTYSTNRNEVTAVHPDGGSVTYEHHSHHGLPRTLTDPAGNTVAFTKNASEQLTSLSNRIGHTTTFAYHPETGCLACITNGRGDVLSCIYSAREQTFTNPVSPAETVSFTFYDLTRIDYPDGNHDAMVFDTRGNLLTYTDGAGKEWRYQYNARGQVTCVTNPTGGTVRYAYNPDATLASRTDSDTGVVTNGYDVYKRLATVAHPGGVLHLAYNLNDQIVAVTNERGKSYSCAYDDNGNLVRVTDPLGEETVYIHDLMDRVTGRTNRLARAATCSYDSMNRLAALTDANGNRTRFAYDTRGRRTSVTDGADVSLLFAYDNEGRVSSVTTPLNRTTTFAHDELGYLTAVTNPLGHVTSVRRDRMSRITAAVDPLARTNAYSYDQRGLLTGVTLADGRAATYEYNDAGMPSTLRDPGGNVWQLAYTGTGRTTSLTDPLSNRWTYAYNARGLLSQVAHPATGTVDLSYDETGNLTRRQYSGGPDLSYTYDDLDRLLTADGIRFAYDKVGRIVSTQDTATNQVFGATHDDGGRLESVTYADGLFTVTYTWNARNLLTGVSDNLTRVGMRFSYDDDGRLTQMVRTNDVNTTWSWDGASRLTRLQQGTWADLRYTYDAAGVVTQAALQLPLGVAGYLTSRVDRLTFDAASGVSTAGYDYDARGRLTASRGHTYAWDGASRLVGAGGVTLTYNGMGDLRTRTVGTATTRYHYNYALDLHPIVAEQDVDSGLWQRFYVLTHNGKLLYMIDAAHGNRVYFYHYDRGGNTLFLTDATGAVTDKYAYTPYGELLRHEGTNQQCFTFGGAHQTRQEGRGLYQMRARYYNAFTACFLSREPLWPRIATPHALNPYQYARQNPAMFVDRTGGSSSMHVHLVGGGMAYSAAAGAEWHEHEPLSGLTTPDRMLPTARRVVLNRRTKGNPAPFRLDILQPRGPNPMHPTTPAVVLNASPQGHVRPCRPRHGLAGPQGAPVGIPGRLKLFDDIWKWGTVDWEEQTPENASPEEDQLIRQTGMLGRGRMSFCLLPFEKAPDEVDAALNWVEPEPELKLWGFSK